MRWCLGIFLLLFFPFINTASVFSQEDPNLIVAKADKVRTPEGSYIFESTVTSFEGEEKKIEKNYRVYVKDLNNTLIEVLSPPADKGKSMLMLEEDVWVFVPRLSKPVRVPLKQRLLGEIAIGDMTRTSFSKDYQASLLQEETANGKETFVLDLKAKSPKKTYAQIKYWVEKGTYHPVKAEFFTKSGQSLKTVHFEEFGRGAGGIRPLKEVFKDSLNPSSSSTMVFKNMEIKHLEDKMFTRDYMSHFQ